MLDDITKTLFLIECKSTKCTSMSNNMLRQNQIDGLLNASEHNLVAGLILNFRNEYNDTFFLSINNYVSMMKHINKKSFNIKDLEKHGAIRIDSEKKRTRYRYNIKKLVGEIIHDK